MWLHVAVAIVASLWMRSTITSVTNIALVLTKSELKAPSPQHTHRLWRVSWIPHRRRRHRPKLRRRIDLRLGRWICLGCVGRDSFRKKWTTRSVGGSVSHSVGALVAGLACDAVTRYCRHCCTTLDALDHDLTNSDLKPPLPPMHTQAMTSLLNAGKEQIWDV